jgi:hypothetical protein
MVRFVKMEVLQQDSMEVVIAFAHEDSLEIIVKNLFLVMLDKMERSVKMVVAHLVLIH